MEAQWHGAEERRFLDCVHCGLCLPACPTYLELGTEMDSPRGRVHLIKGLRSGAVEPSSAVVRHLDLCLGCRACETACPSGVRFAELLAAARSHLVEARARPRAKALRAWTVRQIFARPACLRMLLLPVRLAQRVGVWPLFRRLVPGGALIPILHREEKLPEEVGAAADGGRRVGFVTGCVNQVLFASTNAATIRVLTRNRCRVYVPPSQGCCGALHLHGGARKAAQAMARALLDCFPEDLDVIVVNAAGCGAMLKEYGDLLRADPAYAERARVFAGKVRDVTEFLAGLPLDVPGRASPSRATYHDACHLAHGQGVRAAPRVVVGSIPGIELVELDEADHCCGRAGRYNPPEPAMARRLLRRKVENVRAAEAGYVLVANPGCVLQIAAGLRAAGVAAEVLHPVELLDRAYQGEL